MEINRIYNGDCIELIMDIPDESVNVILTDPPYLYLKNQKLDRPFDEQTLFENSKRVLKKDGFIVLFGRGTSFYRWNTILADLGFIFKEEIIWNKIYNSSPVLPIQRFHESISIHTFCGHLNKNVTVPYLEVKQYNIDSIIGDIKRIKSALNNTKELDALNYFLTERIKPVLKRRNDKTSGCTISRNSTGLFNIPASVLSCISKGAREKSIIDCCHDRYKRIHPTQKPIRLLERILQLVSKDGDLILDPFSGSGSTAVACVNKCRNYIGFEIDEEYYSASVNRISNVNPKLF